MSLPYKRRLFVEAYLQTWNATAAARQANYAHPMQQGQRLLRNVEIRAAIEQRLQEKAMTADEVLHRLSEQARVSLSDFLRLEETDGGPVVTGIDWEEVRRRGHLVKSITPTRFGFKLELYDSQAALFTLAKRHGLVIDRHDVTSAGKEIRLHDEYQERALATLAQAVGVALFPGTLTESEGTNGRSHD